MAVSKARNVERSAQRHVAYHTAKREQRRQKMPTDWPQPLKGRHRGHIGSGCKSPYLGARMGPNAVIQIHNGCAGRSAGFVSCLEEVRSITEV